MIISNNFVMIVGDNSQLMKWIVIESVSSRYRFKINESLTYIDRRLMKSSYFVLYANYGVEILFSKAAIVNMPESL